MSGIASFARRHRAGRRRSRRRSTGRRRRAAIAQSGARSARLVNDPAVEAANRKPPTPPISRRSRCSWASALAGEAIPSMRRPPHPPCRTADRLGAHVRPDAGRDHRRDPVRRLGGGRREGARAGRERRDRVRALPSSRRGRADGRHHQPVDAGVDRARARRAAVAPSATSTKGWARCCASAPTVPR